MSRDKEKREWRLFAAAGPLRSREGWAKGCHRVPSASCLTCPFRSRGLRTAWGVTGIPDYGPLHPQQLLVALFWSQSLTVWLWLASNPQRSVCLSFASAGIEGSCHQTWPPNLYMKGPPSCPVAGCPLPQCSTPEPVCPNQDATCL